MQKFGELVCKHKRIILIITLILLIPSIIGMTATSLDTRDLSNSEVAVYVVIAVLLCLIVLEVALDSYVVPILLANIGIAILYNMGTNVFLGEISYITKTYNSFTIAQEGVETNSKFIMIIDAVKKQESTKQKYILVVEDDKNLRKLIKTYLQKSKYNTYEATNGEEESNVLDQNYIDLIVSDIMMLQMDGYELIKSLREAKYDVPILIITEKSEIEDKKEGFLLGADDYMVKPINVEEMLLRIQVLLKRSKSASKKKIQIK